MLMNPLPTIIQPAQTENLLSQRGPAHLCQRIVDPIEERDWDSAVSALPGCSFFHSTAWATVLSETYGFKPTYLGLFEGRSLKAALPLMECKKPFGGSRGIALPFTDECSPIVTEAQQSAALIQEALAQGASRQWRYVEFRGDNGSLHDQRASQTFLGHRLSLTTPIDKLFEQLDSSVRTAIRKSERLGVEVEVSSSLDALAIFYQLHCRTRRRHGLPPQPFAFFRNIHRHIFERGLGFVSLAKHCGRAIAASVFFFFGNKVIYKFGASDERFQEVRGNNSVMWQAIKHMAAQGMGELTFGRTDVGEEGLRRFKLGWGSTEYRISYRKYDVKGRQFISAKDRVTGWYNHVFRRMPIPILRSAGNILYRFVT